MLLRIEFSFCLSAVYGSLFLFSLLSTVECGGCTTLGQSLFGSAGRFNSPTEVVGDCPEGCDLHETDHGSPLRLCPDTSLLEILNITHARTFPPPNVHTARRFLDGVTSSRRCCCVTRPAPRRCLRRQLRTMPSCQILGDLRSSTPVGRVKPQSGRTSPRGVWDPGR